METTSPVQLLALWERGTVLPAVQRAGLLLRAAAPSVPDDVRARWSVGRADRELVAWREGLFGRRFEAVCRCPSCQETVELAFASADLPRACIPDSSDVTRRVTVAGREIRYRAPTWPDLVAAAAEPDAARAWRVLVGRCIEEMETDGVRAPVLAAASEAVARELELEDPLACTRISLRCPGCAHEWSHAFDVVGYIWQELDQWARQTLREIHQLARAYGWTEEEILAVPARRRRLYLEMIAS